MNIRVCGWEFDRLWWKFTRTRVIVLDNVNRPKARRSWRLAHVRRTTDRGLVGCGLPLTGQVRVVGLSVIHARPRTTSHRARFAGTRGCCRLRHDEGLRLIVLRRVAIGCVVFVQQVDWTLLQFVVATAPPEEESEEDQGGRTDHTSDDAT